MTAALLLEFAWKSGLLAGAALLGAALLRARPPAERVVILRLGVVMILALPLLALLMPAMRIDAPRFIAPVGPPAVALADAFRSGPDRVAAAPVAPAAAIERTAGSPAPARPDPARRLDIGSMAIAAWAVGAVLLLLRLGAGVATLHRWTRRADPVRDTRWLSALDRAAPTGRRPVLRASSRVRSPLSWGVRPAVILLSVDALEQAGRADAILTHEMGHVRRGDWLFLMLTRLLVAALWFNPLVWLLHRQLAAQSEQAADAWAIRRIDRTDYATTLVAMAAGRRPHAALGMAAPKGELARRVTAIMTGSTSGGGRWPTALAVAGCVAIATPLAALELTAPAIAPVLGLVAPARPTAVDTTAPAPVIGAVRLDAGAPGPRDLTGRDSSVLEQPGQGPAEMEAGAAQMETHARGMRALAAGLPDPADRADLLAEADELDREAAQLRGEARALSAELRATEVSADVEASVAAAVNATAEAENAMNIRVNANANIDLGAPRPPRPPTAPRFVPAPGPVPSADAARSHRRRAASMRASARGMRQTAAGMEATADQAERTSGRGAPPGMVDERRGQAADLRAQADELDAQASQAEAPG
jgi:beta-lactamase regulating signal transducer with metallopeptidase domain